MKMKDAMDVINRPVFGYMVTFEWIENGRLRSDHFPDKHAGEPLIETLREAWDLCKTFAAKTKGSTCNLYVVDANFAPVNGYKDKEIKNRYAKV